MPIINPITDVTSTEKQTKTKPLKDLKKQTNKINFLIKLGVVKLQVPEVT